LFHLMCLKTTSKHSYVHKTTLHQEKNAVATIGGSGPICITESWLDPNAETLLLLGVQLRLMICLCLEQNPHLFKQQLGFPKKGYFLQS